MTIRREHATNARSQATTYLSVLNGKEVEIEEQSNREYSSKVLASKDLHYIFIGIKEMGSICGLNYRMPEEKGKA